MNFIVVKFDSICFAFNRTDLTFKDFRFLFEACVSVSRPSLISAFFGFYLLGYKHTFIRVYIYTYLHLYIYIYFYICNLRSFDKDFNVHLYGECLLSMDYLPDLVLAAMDTVGSKTEMYVCCLYGAYILARQWDVE